jgi:hypothetical protein
MAIVPVSRRPKESGSVLEEIQSARVSSPALARQTAPRALAAQLIPAAARKGCVYLHAQHKVPLCLCHPVEVIPS